MGIIPPQPPTNLEYNPTTPATPMTPGNFFSPTSPITPFNRAAHQVSSTYTAQYTQPVDGVQSTHTYSPHERTE